MKVFFIYIIYSNKFAGPMHQIMNDCTAKNFG